VFRNCGGSSRPSAVSSLICPPYAEAFLPPPSRSRPPIPSLVPLLQSVLGPLTPAFSDLSFHDVGGWILFDPPYLFR